MEDVSLEKMRSGATRPVVDFATLSLDRLAELDDSVLIGSINRFLGDVNNPSDVIFAGFNASI